MFNFLCQRESLSKGDLQNSTFLAKEWISHISPSKGDWSSIDLLTVIGGFVNTWFLLFGWNDQKRRDDKSGSSAQVVCLVDNQREKKTFIGRQ